MFLTPPPPLPEWEFACGCGLGRGVQVEGEGRTRLPGLGALASHRAQPQPRLCPPGDAVSQHSPESVIVPGRGSGQ